ncbi:MAG: DUF502 domain-containing protein [Candidatus Omnitrophica bacterium]|nr:DUF502 domain-containing protein [Candidatus Omnitrophota bacterium]
MFSRLRTYFLSGMVVFLPVALTIYLFIIALDFADGFLGKFLQPYFMERFGFYFHGLGILLGVYIIILIGFFVTNFFGKKIHAFFERILIKLPFFRQVYPAFKEIAMFLFSREKMAFKQVVIVEYPRKGLYSFGFLTNEMIEKINKITRQDLCNVFMPSAPGPLTGYVIMVPKKDVVYTDLSVEETVKFIISGGVVNPGNL